MTTSSISFSPAHLREAAAWLPEWFNEGHAIWLRHTATDTELTMIGDGMREDDRLWDLFNRLLADHTADHLKAKAIGAIDPDDIA